MVLVVILKLHTGPAVTSAVVLGVGGLFCVLSVMQNLYHWRLEKTRADDGLPVYGDHTLLLQKRTPLHPSPCHAHHSPPQTADANTAATQGELGCSEKNELSTLV